MPIFIPVESGQGLVTVLLLTYCIQMKYLFNGSLPTRLKLLESSVISLFRSVIFV